MKSNTFKTVVLGVGTIIITNFSYAQSEGNRERKEPPTYEQLIKEMDKNEDGKLSRDEVKGPLKDDFKTIDTDEDGFISEKEFEKAPKPKRRERNK